MQVFLVRHRDVFDYTHEAKPEPVKPIKTGLTRGPRGDFVMSADLAASLTAAHRRIGPTITLMESGVKVSARAVEIIAGPFEVRDEPSDEPRYPKMTRSIVATPRGEIAWSNAAASYLLPNGSKSHCLSQAIRTTLEIA
jgi:hypothetical protein